MTASAAHQCTCPDAIRADNHRCKTEKWWNTPEYRARSDAFLKAHPKCEYCGKKSNVVHHDNRDSYKSKEEYYDLERNGTAACTRCHEAYRLGMRICPICKKHYFAKDNGHSRCRFCRGMKYPGPKKGGRKPRLNHPCGNRIGQQRCQRDGRMFVCGYSSKNARDCDHFTERKPAPVGCGDAVAKKGVRA